MLYSKNDKVVNMCMLYERPQREKKRKGKDIPVTGCEGP
jgi:hypothetical protein